MWKQFPKRLTQVQVKQTARECESKESLSLPLLECTKEGCQPGVEGPDDVTVAENYAHTYIREQTDLRTSWSQAPNT